VGCHLTTPLTFHRAAAMTETTDTRHPREWTPTCEPTAQFLPGHGLSVPEQRPRSGGVLVLYFSHGLPFAENVVEHAKSFKRYSRFPVWNVNTRFPFPPALAELDFAAIILHYSLFGSSTGPLGPILGTPLYLLNQDHVAFLRTSAARKVAIFQDELSFGRARWNFSNEFGIDCVYTCLEPSEWDKTWRRYTSVPDLRTTLPGYVDDGLIEVGRRFAKPADRRSVDVGYRGRPIPIFMDTSREKTLIGERFNELAGGSALRLDVSVEEGDRIYGDDWYRFLADSRTTLGVESGGSVVDCEDEVRNDYERLVVEQGEVTLDDLRRTSLARWDNLIRYWLIGPRHFEAAALRSCQVLFEGSYSGAIEPFEHYIPLRKDFSNLDEVLSLVRDRRACEEIAERAYGRLIASGEFSYRSFIAGVDRDLLEAGLTPEIERREARTIRRAWRRGRRRRLFEHWFRPRFDRLWARVFGPD